MAASFFRVSLEGSFFFRVSCHLGGFRANVADGSLFFRVSLEWSFFFKVELSLVRF